MSITDELRKYVSDWRKAPRLMECLDAGDVDGILQDFLYIADRIDAGHRAALEKVAAMVDEPDKRREAYCDRFIARTVDEDAVTAALYDLEKRIERIERRLEDLRHRLECVERLLSHKGGAA